MIKQYNGNNWNTKTYVKKISSAEFTQFPLVVRSLDQSVTSWSLEGNAVQGVGERTANLLEYYIDGILAADGTISASQSYQMYFAPVTAGETYTMGDTIDVYGFFSSIPAMGSVTNDGTRHFRSSTVGGVIEIPSGTTWLGCRVRTGVNAMLNTGSTALPYEPYGYKIPIVTNSTTLSPIYLPNPLRKSLDGTAVDTMDSTGLVTYNVDSTGTPLVTPTTAQVTVPTIPTTSSPTTITFNTTVKPSEMSLTFNGFKVCRRKKYQNNAWT